ncbi:Com family DNA-binding transcriptional regulator [Planococcus dechangensis]|uniref:Com family DNA-binding transcriptional regulator n=1 Tax=Planococcus dechangensis TaxID=1176255 RepID=A0ABV9MG42_9BACL
MTQKAEKQELAEARCANCNKLLAKIEKKAEIKCHKCGHYNHYVIK